MHCSITRRYSATSTSRSEQGNSRSPSLLKLPSHSMSCVSLHEREYWRSLSSAMRSKYARRLKLVSSMRSSVGSCSKFQAGCCMSFFHDRCGARRSVLDQLDRHLVRAFDERELDAAVREAAWLCRHLYVVAAQAREGCGEIVYAEAQVIDNAAARRDQRAATVFHRIDDHADVIRGHERSRRDLHVTIDPLLGLRKAAEAELLRIPRARCRR